MENRDSEIPSQNLYVLNQQVKFDNPQEVLDEVIFIIHQGVDSDTFYTEVFPLFVKIGLPIPKIKSVGILLRSESTTEDEAHYILTILFHTGSKDTFREEIDAALQRFPNLRGQFQVQ